MAEFLRAGTASQKVVIGPFVNTSGTPVTSLTLTSASVRLRYHGQSTYTNCSGTTTATHVENGTYLVTFDATDSANVGRLDVLVYDTNAMPVRHDFTVLASPAYDAIVSGADYLTWFGKVWDVLTADHTTTATFGKVPSVSDIWAQALTECTTVPAATASVLTAIDWIFMQHRNKMVQTTATGTLFADNGTTTVAQAGVTTATGTFTRAEWA